jgi:hypothetical protein
MKTSKMLLFWLAGAMALSANARAEQVISIATNAALSADGFTPTNHAGVDGAFIPTSATPDGALQVTLTGGGSGAEWQVDTNGTYLKSGVTVSNLAAGSHTISFKPVSAWNTPASQMVTITNGETTKAAGVYTATEKPVLTVTSPKSGASVSSALLTIAGTVKDDVAVASVNYQLNNSGVWSPATIASSLTNWTQNVTLNPGSNTISLWAEDSYGNLSATNSLSVFYTVLTPLSVAVIGPGKVSTDYNTSNLVIGKPYSMTATPDSGCKLTDWIVSVNSSVLLETNALKLNFLMAAGMSISANFRDVTPPTVSITAPASTKGSNSVVTLSGKAGDNVGVQSVYYTVNAGPANGAVLTTNGYANWSAVLILNPGTNVVRFYAADGAAPIPNISAPAEITLVDESGGYAPQLLDGVNVTLYPVLPQPDSPGRIYCGMSTFAYVYSASNFYVGDYVFSMLDANTVQITHQAITPVAGDAGSLTLMFTGSTNGTYTNSYGDEGNFTLGGATGAALSSVDGARIEEMAVGSGFFTYFLTNGTFIDPPGFAEGGIFTWAVYSPQMAMLTATFTNVGSIGVTNYALLNFGDSSYDSELAGPAGVTYSSGTFSLTPAAKAPGGYAPESLAGWTVVVTSVETETNGTVEAASSVIGFGPATIGEIDTLGTNIYSEVGNYTYTRTGPNTGFGAPYFTAPPPEIGPGGGVFTFTSPTSGNFKNGNNHGTFTMSLNTPRLPDSLVGMTMTLTPASSSQGSKKVTTFGYDTLTSVSGGVATVKSYSFAPYGPQVALLQDWDASETGYIVLWFSDPTSGSFVVTAVQSDGSVSTGSGTFKIP